MKQHHPELVVTRMFLNKDNNSFKSLYHIYYRPLCYFAYNIIRDKNRAEEIANESLIKIYVFRKTFNNNSSIKSFLYIMARNACINFLKEKYREVRSDNEIHNLSEKGYKLIEEEKENAYIMQEIYHQIEELPQQSAEVFRLIFLEGKNTFEIARQMGISHETALSQKEKAFKMLRVELLTKNLMPFLPA